MQQNPARGQPLSPTVNPDIYNYDKVYAAMFKRLQTDRAITVEENRVLLRKFLESREARGLSISRVVKYGTQLIVLARFCVKPFNSMDADDIRELLVRLKNQGKHGDCWRKYGTKYSDNTMCDIKIFLKVFWRWMKGMDESKPIYPPEVSWFTKGKVKASSVTRSDLLTEDEIELLAGATGNAQDCALVKVLDDAGGRITEILTLRIGDVERRPYGFKLNVWVSKTYAHPIPIATSAPALARWLSLHPLRDNPKAPLWLNSKLGQLKYSSASWKMKNIVACAEQTSGKKFWKRVFFHLFRHTSATEFMSKAKGSQGVMNKKYGWSANSNMPAVYSHLVDTDVEEAVARADAHVDDLSDMMEQKEQPRPKKCPRCESTNDPSAKYCSRCAFPLDGKAAFEAFEAEEKKSEAEGLLGKLLNDERVRKVMLEVLSEDSAQKYIMNFMEEVIFATAYA
jgi:integrase